MTLPAAPNPISLNQIKTEFGPSKGYSNAISHYRNTVLGRPSGAVSFSEFRGRSAEVTYLSYMGPATRVFEAYYGYSTAFGPAYVYILNTTQGANNQIMFFHASEGAYAAAWSHFLRVVLPDGRVYYKASWTGPYPPHHFSLEYMQLYQPPAGAPGNVQFIYG